jgi:2-amino-4-hydroxy-6-hydroxymethyldihydropteridine diphosphokinase
MSSGFLLGIGSNIEPEKSIVAIVDLLLNTFPELSVSRVLRTPPIGINSHHDFLNMVMFINTNMEEAELKTICNNIEEQLGRDRSDPNRKHKDHAADIDILAKIDLSHDAAIAPDSLAQESFFHPLIAELYAFLQHHTYQPKQAGTPLNRNELTFGESATTINR